MLNCASSGHGGYLVVDLLGVSLKVDLVVDLVVGLVVDQVMDLVVDLAVDLLVDLLVILLEDLVMELGVDLKVDLVEDLVVALSDVYRSTKCTIVSCRSFRVLTKDLLKYMNIYNTFFNVEFPECFWCVKSICRVHVYIL